MRLGHGSYRFSTAGRLIGPEPSMVAASRKEGTAQLSYDLVAGEVVAEAAGTAAAVAAGTVSGVFPGPPSSRQPTKASGGGAGLWADERQILQRGGVWEVQGGMFRA